MELPVLKDKSVYPHDDLVFSIIGTNSVYWKNILEGIHEAYPASEDVWTYYNDGKNWLFRVLLKKKTLFWMAVLENSFRVTFYFGDKAEPVIEKSNLPDGIKASFRNGPRYGKIRPIYFQVTSQADVDNALAIARIKAALK